MIQKTNPIKGIDIDSHPTLADPNSVRFAKNVEVKNIGNIDYPTGENGGVVKPVLSNSTNFDSDILPRQRTFEIDLSALDLTDPQLLYGYIVDYVETVSLETITVEADLDNFFTALGFTVVGTKIYSISLVDEVWQKVTFIQSQVTTVYDFTLEDEGDLVGDNITIGSLYDIRRNEMYFFNYNDSNRHHIIVYNDKSEVYTKIIEAPILNFSYTNRVGYDIDLVETKVLDDDTLQRLLYWTDGVNPPRKINVDRALSGEYIDSSNGGLQYSSDDEFICAVKYPPDISPFVNFSAKDPDVATNNIAFKNFQFRSKFIYDDNDYSTYSSISTLSFINDYNEDQFSLLPNYTNISFSAGSVIVRKVEIAYREGNTDDWRTYQILDRSDIVSDAIYNYNPIDNTFEYNFYNDRGYSAIAIEQSEKLFDKSPILARTQDMLSNNTLAYADILEDYDNLDLSVDTPTITVDYSDDFINKLKLTLTLSDFTLTWDTFPSAFSSTWEIIRVPSGSDNETVIGEFIYDDTTTPPATFIIETYQVNIGDKVYVKNKSITGANNVTIGLASILSGNYDLASPLNPCGDGDFNVETSSFTQQVFTGGEKIEYTNVITDTCSTWSVPNSWHTSQNQVTNHQLKQGGNYRIGLIGFDDANRSTFVSKIEDVYINSIVESGGNKKVTITIDFNNHVFPDWVKKIAVCRTKNTLIDRSLGLGYLQTTIDGVTPVLTERIDFNINPQNTFNSDNFFRTTTNYSYSDGDIVRFITNSNGVLNTDIIDRVIKSEDGVTFTVDYDAQLTTLANGDIVEIYTPAKQLTTDTYYEIGQRLALTETVGDNRVVNNTVTLETFDTYFTDRAYLGTSFLFESHSRADTIPDSQGEDIGRSNIENPNAKQVWKPSLLRYSLVFNPDSFVNGLSSFDSSRQKLFNRQYGNITKIYCNQSELHIFQIDNVFKCLINKRQIRQADGTIQLIASDEIISDPLDTLGDYGCQNEESIMFRDNKFTFWDIKRGYMVQYDGQQSIPISDLGIGSYIQSQSKTVTASFNNFSPILYIKLNSGYDPINNRYLITTFQRTLNSNDEIHIEDGYTLDKHRATFSFDLDAKNWASFYPFIPEFYSRIDGSKLGMIMVTFRKGIPYFHNKKDETTYNTFYGTETNQYIKPLCNLSSTTVKNFLGMGYDSKFKSNAVESIAYEAVEVTTSNGQLSNIPLSLFKFKEGVYYSSFLRNTSLGKTILTGDNLKGKFAEVMLKRDSTQKTVYNELQEVFFYITPSEQTNK